MELVTLVLARELGAASTEIGLMFIISGVGGFAGTLVGPCLLRHLRAGMVVLGYAWVAHGGGLRSSQHGQVWTRGIVGVIAFLSVPTVNACVMARIATDGPDALNGGVFSATTRLTALFYPVGPAIAGVTLQAVGSTMTVTIYAVRFGFLAILASASPVLCAER